MVNTCICTGQQQILIILTWIVRAITKVLKKAITFLGTQYFFLCWYTVYKGLYGFWPFKEQSLKHGSYFSVLPYLEINKKYLPKNFPVNIQYKFAEKKHLRHFCQTFSALLLTVIDKMQQKKIQHVSALNIGFQA